MELKHSQVFSLIGALPGFRPSDTDFNYSPTNLTSLFNIILFSVTHKMQGSEQHSTDCLESLSKIWLKTYHLQGLGHIAWLEFLQGIKNEWSIYEASKWGVVKFIKFIKTYKNSNSQTEQREVPGSLGNYCSMSSSLRGPVNPSPSKAENIFQLEYSLQEGYVSEVHPGAGRYTQRGPRPGENSAGPGQDLELGAQCPEDWDFGPAEVLIRNCIKMSYTFCHF